MTTKSCAIILNSGSYPDRMAEILAQVDCIIATDGAYNYCTTLGIAVDVVIGDMDSITQPITNIKPEIIHLSRQDSTDAEKALNYAQTHKFTYLHCLGILGDRFDHSYYHLQLLVNNQKRFKRIAFYSKTEYGAFFQQDVVILGTPQQRVSFISFYLQNIVLETDGLYWPIKQLNAQTSSISNRFNNNEAHIRIINNQETPILMLAEILADTPLATIEHYLPKPL